VQRQKQAAHRCELGCQACPDVRADKPIECCTLTRDAFERLGETHAELKIGLLQNLLRMVTQIANRMTEEVLGLEG
jgi:hypothetical protein